jgi:hypothetical protein
MSAVDPKRDVAIELINVFTRNEKNDTSGRRPERLTGLHFYLQVMFCNGIKKTQFAIRLVTYKQKDMTLNQRVQGSNPCAPFTSSKQIKMF